MSLARIKVWTAGDLLTAADLNGEFSNILTNPISLISPTTGVINFNSLAHTNFRLQNVATTPTAATTGLIYLNTSKSQVEVDDGAVIRYVPTITSVTSGDLILGSSLRTWKRLAVGSTGQVLNVSSSNTDPAWGVVPPDGGLSTTVPSTGMLYFISTDNKLVGLTIGTNGQVLTVSAASKPSWAAASGGGGATVPSTSADIISLSDDFLLMYSSVGATLPVTSTVGAGSLWSYESGVFEETAAGTIALKVAKESAGNGIIAMYSTGTGSANTVRLNPISGDFGRPVSSTMHYTLHIRFIQHTTAAGSWQIGLAASTSGNRSTSQSSTLYIYSSGSTGTLKVVSISSAGETGEVNTSVTGASWHTFDIQVTSSATVVTADGLNAGTIASSAISHERMGFQAGVLTFGAVGVGMAIDYVNILTSASIRV